MLREFIRKVITDPTDVRPAVAQPIYSVKSRFDYRASRSEPVGLARDLYPSFNSGEAWESYVKEALNAPNMPENLGKDSIPIPAPHDREGYYADRHFCYWLSGLDDFNRLLRELPHDFSLSRILDFGGASGRVARHFIAAGKGDEVIVADLNVNNIEWIEEFFPETAKGLKVSSYPTIPLGDACVDLVYAFSVFTHIDTYESSWVAEVARILRPGGRAYLTIHSEHTWSLLPDIFLFQTLRNNEAFNQLFHKGAPMPAKRLVFDYEPNSHDYSCNVFHHTDYIRHRWGKWLNIIKIIPSGHGYQTAVVCEKR